MASLATRNNRIQRWFDFLSAYSYVLIYRPGRLNGNADVMSRLPSPATEQDASPDLRLTDPDDLDVSMIGAGGVVPARIDSELGTRALGRRGQGPCEDLVVGGEEHLPQPLTTDEISRRTWQVIQEHKIRDPQRLADTEERRAVPDDTKLIESGNTVISGRWESGLILHACPMTEIGRRLLGIKQKSDVFANNSGEEGGGVHESPGSGIAQAINSEEARRFGERLCEKTASDWAQEQLKDPTAKVVLELIEAGKGVSDIKTGTLPEDVVEDEVKRLVAQGTIMELPDSKKLLVRRSSRAPVDRPNRNPGRYERLLGSEPVRTYVPLLLRPWVMDCAHKEVVHLGEKVTLGLLQRVYWWVGMAESVNWWCRRCYSCRFRKVPRNLLKWPLVSLPLPSRPGQMVSFDYLGPLPKTPNGNEYIFLVVDLFSRHAEGYAITKGENNSKGFVSIMVNDYIPRWGCPHTFLSDRGPEFAIGVAKGVFKVLGSVKKFTSSYHPQTNGMVERLNHTLCQMLSHLIADDQKNWDELLLHAIAAHSNNVSRNGFSSKFGAHWSVSKTSHDNIRRTRCERTSGPK